MRAAFLGLAIGLGGLTLAHCGGSTTAGDNPDFEPPREDVARYDERFGPRPRVVGGEVRVSSLGANLARWGNDDRLRQIVVMHPGSCAGCSCEASFLTVHAFLLMAYEVTTDAWRVCMADGACKAPDVALPGTSWDAPERARAPVAVTWAAARGFCRHYGGDLPTLGQWNRAAHGEDLDLFGVAGVMDQVAACGTQGRPSCSEVVDPDRWQASGMPVQGPVGRHGWDIGPFGHHDLYGSAAEWTRFYRELPPLECARAMPESDFSQRSNEPLSWYALRPQSVWSEQVLTHKPPPYTSVCSETTNDALAPPPYVGFRCAFPEGAQ